MVNIGNLPNKTLRARATERMTEYTIYRFQTTTGSTGDDITEWVDTGETVRLNLYGHQEKAVQMGHGEHLTATVKATMRPEGSLEVDDRIEHEGSRYEVIGIYPKPADNPTIKEVRLVRVVDQKA